MTPPDTDYQAIINEAAEKLEARFSQIQQELKPLRDEERDVAEAIKRIVGSYPDGYGRGSSPIAGERGKAAGGGNRARMSPDERELQVLEIVNANSDGVNARRVAEGIGVSTATATKAINALLESGRIRSEGQRAGRKLYPA